MEISRVPDFDVYSFRVPSEVGASDLSIYIGTAPQRELLSCRGEALVLLVLAILKSCLFFTRDIHFT
jgi:hypothetical protein